MKFIFHVAKEKMPTNIMGLKIITDIFYLFLIPLKQQTLHLSLPCFSLIT